MSSGFSFNIAPPKTTAPATGFGGFGTTATAGGGAGGFSFGGGTTAATAAPAAQGFSFGGAPAPNAPAPTTFSLGGLAAQAPAPAAGTFSLGNPVAAPSATAPPSAGFSMGSAAPAGGFSFSSLGSTAATQPKPALGGFSLTAGTASSTAPTGGFMFSQKAASATTAPAIAAPSAGGFGFNSLAQQPQQAGSAAGGGFMLGGGMTNSQPATATAAGGGLFSGLGAPASATTAAQGTAKGFTLGGAGITAGGGTGLAAALAQPLAGGALSTTPASSLGGLRMPTAATPAAGPAAGFSFNTPAAAPQQQQKQQQSTSALGSLLGSTTAAPTTAAAAATVAPTLGGLLTAASSAAAAPKPTGAAVAISAAAPATAAAAVAPVAAAAADGITAMTYRQLEESINKWTIELEEQESIFLNQATQVNAWDRLLMDNADKITQLNSDVEKVKLDQQRLDHELDFILAQQRELEGLLRPLEESVAQLPPVAYQQHSDVERERTYKMTESIDAQLKQMSTDLKEIIEHINSSSGAGHDSNNPMMQMMKILNAHMDSLDWIDQNTGILQRRTEEVAGQVNSQRAQHENSFRMPYK